jgi:DNA-binding transcriptional regulator LsrR (DeoR family)
MLHDGDVVGLSGGVAVNSLIGFLAPEKCTQKIEVLQLSGVFSEQNPESSAFYAAQQMAGKFGCSWSPLLLPVIADSMQSREILTSEPSFRELDAKFSQVNVALVGVGSLVGANPDSELYRRGYLRDEDLTELRKHDAVAVILSHILDSNGNPLITPVAERSICMPLEQFRKVAFSIGIAGGEARIRPLYAALKGGWINHLITDSNTAKGVMALAR